MKNIKHKYITLFGLLFITSVSGADAVSKVKSVHISADPSAIQIGEPFFITVDVFYLVSPSGTRTGKPAKSINEHWQLVVANSKEEIETVKFYKGIRKYDKQGLHYGNHFQISYNYNKRKLIFTEPGEYTLRLNLKSKNVASNSIHVEVNELSDSTNDALTLLKGPEDYAYLFDGMEGLEHKPDISKRLQDIIDLYGDSVLADYASVRLGIVKFSETIVSRNNITKDSFQDCLDYLKSGLNLSAHNPIREEALFYIALTTYRSGDDIRAAEYIDHLVKEFPNGKRKSDVEKLKVEVAHLKNNNQQQIEE